MHLFKRYSGGLLALFHNLLRERLQLLSCSGDMFLGNISGKLFGRLNALVGKVAGLVNQRACEIERKDL